MEWGVLIFALAYFFVSYQLWVPKFGEKIDKILSVMGMIISVLLIIGVLVKG